LIADGRHPDCRIIEPNNDTIKIDQIRDLQREASLASIEVAWRIFLLPNIERATREAANSLLKTLEEPPPRVVLLLTTLDANALLPTMTSRCRVIPLRPLSVHQVEAALKERWNVDEDQAALLARLSGGRIGWAVSALEDNGVLERRQAEIDIMCALSSTDRVGRLELALQLSRNEAHWDEILALWLSWWRDLMLIKADIHAATTNVDYLETLRSQAAGYEMQQITDTIRAIKETIQRIDANINRQLAFEVLFLNVPS
jgi:DNA polymerase-3 subunit delta'